MYGKIIQYLASQVFWQSLNKTKEVMNHEEKREKADDIIKNHLGFAAAAALVPIPGADIAAVSAVQLNMLRQLANLYRVSFTDNLGKNIITALVSGSLARVGASLVKAIPGIGTLIGEFTMPALSAASTYALGQVFASHLAKGGTLENFDVTKARKKYDEELKHGKQAAKEAAAKTETIEEDVVAKLKKLAELKDAGILSEEEFIQMKSKLLAQM
jgi:uncharacterized protein (DUF697 family)